MGMGMEGGDDMFGDGDGEGGEEEDGAGGGSLTKRVVSSVEHTMISDTN